MTVSHAAFLNSPIVPQGAFGFFFIIIILLLNTNSEILRSPSQRILLLFICCEKSLAILWLCYPQGIRASWPSLWRWGASNRDIGVPDSTQPQLMEEKQVSYTWETTQVQSPKPAWSYMEEV